MGADGHITIWRRDDVLREWPDADELIACLPNAYQRSLHGVEYYYCYRGDNLWEEWTDPHDWYVRDKSPDFVERLRAFVAWLGAHGTTWEVWT